MNNHNHNRDAAAILPRTEIVTKLWSYIKKRKLQDNGNSRTVNTGEKVLALFGKNQVSMFEMAGIINRHIR